MTAELLVYTDIKSPYAYLAKAWLYDLERDYDVTLDWRHYTLNIPSYLDDTETRSQHNWRRVKYAYMDARRIAKDQGVKLYGPKKIYDTEPVGIAFYYAKESGVLYPFMDEAFERFWDHTFAVEDLNQIREILAHAGADPDGYDAYRAGSGKALHDELRADAEARGVFGVPSVIFNDELFFGGDRIDWVRRRLEEAGLRKAA
jgi:2-hydroxychromene-2-carboxylate isomerase